MRLLPTRYSRPFSFSVAECRLLLLQGIGVETLVENFAQITNDVNMATAIVLLLTSLLQGRR